jgi:ATP-dependent Lon protease
VALISALAEVAVRRDVCMTGEITLRGRVLPVGGLKEKVLAAHRAGIRRMILPTKNRNDLIDIPQHMRRELDFIFVDRMEEVLDAALLSEDGAEVPDDRAEAAS